MPAGLLTSLKSLFRGAIHSADTSVVRSIHIIKTKFILLLLFFEGLRHPWRFVRCTVHSRKSPRSRRSFVRLVTLWAVLFWLWAALKAHFKKNNFHLTSRLYCATETLQKWTSMAASAGLSETCCRILTVYNVADAYKNAFDRK